jgi:hypothetical protein
MLLVGNFLAVDTVQYPKRIFISSIVRTSILGNYSLFIGIPPVYWKNVFHFDIAYYP